MSNKRNQMPNEKGLIKTIKDNLFSCMWSSNHSSSKSLNDKIATPLEELYGVDNLLQEWKMKNMISISTERLSINKARSLLRQLRPDIPCHVLQVEHTSYSAEDIFPKELIYFISGCRTLEEICIKYHMNHTLYTNETNQDNNCVKHFKLLFNSILESNSNIRILRLVYPQVFYKQDKEDLFKYTSKHLEKSKIIKLEWSYFESFDLSSGFLLFESAELKRFNNQSLFLNVQLFKNWLLMNESLKHKEGEESQTTLDLTHLTLTDALFKSIISDILDAWEGPLNTKIKKIKFPKSVKGINPIQAENIAHFVDILLKKKAFVESLDFSGNSLKGANNLRVLGKYIELNPNLKMVKIDSPDMSIDDISMLCEYIHGNVILDTLWLSSVDILSKSNYNKESEKELVNILQNTIHQSGLQNLYINGLISPLLIYELNIPVEKREIPVKSATKSAAKLMKII